MQNSDGRRLHWNSLRSTLCKTFYRCRELMQPASRRPLRVLVFCETWNADRLTPEIVCRQLHSSSPLSEKYANRFQWLCSGSSQAGECMHTIAAICLPRPPRSPLVTSGHATVRPSDSNNFIVCIELQFVHFMSFWFTCFGSPYMPRFECGTEKIHFQKFIFLSAYISS